MADNIYSKIGKATGKDVRIVRAAAHHPFEFFGRVMEDPEDHRPVRLRYLGVFFVKPYWRKGLMKTSKVGLPENGDNIWARVPEQKYSKTYINLKQGKVKEGTFISTDGNVECPVTQIQFWKKLSKYDELS